MSTPSTTWTEEFAGTKLDLSGYSLTFADDFNAMSISTGKQSATWYSGVHADFGAAGFARGANGLSPFSVSDGALHVTMQNVNGTWQSGQLQTVDNNTQGFKQSYGYFEMRAKFPDGAGSWPGFWLMSEENRTDPTKARVEIDTVEGYAADPSGLHTTIHYTPGGKTPDLTTHLDGGAYDRVNASMFDGQYHTYGTMVTPQWIISYFDGEEVARVAANDYTKSPFYMIIDLAMSDSTNADPNHVYSMDVDYVHAYSNPTAVALGEHATSGNDTLTGTAQDDVLNGLTGADTMSGGLGNDTYWVDNVGDHVVEAANAGIDTVNSSIDYTLPTNVENLLLYGKTAVAGTGNGLDNTITGNGLDNVLKGMAGNDTLIGNGGNDTLDGGTGADKMIGGTGNDTYYVDNIHDVVIENAGEGYDTVHSTVSFAIGTQSIEKVILDGTANISAIGGDGNETLIGNSGNNILDGGAGNDTMIGGAGNDTYYVDSASDVVVEKPGEGTDTVHSMVNFSLKGTNVEILYLDGTANLTANGSDGNDTIYGNAGNNIINGRGGADMMAGGAGDDTYYVDNPGDHVVEAAGQGYDTVFTSVSFNAGTQSIEKIMLMGTASINATGSADNNTIIGNSGNNVLDGGAGDDWLSGRGGVDTLTGGAGADTFAFETQVGYHLVSKITDFTHGVDKIALSTAVFGAAGGAGALDPHYFEVNNHPTSADSHIIYNQATGMIYYDVDGNTSTAWTPFAQVTPGTVLDASDFYLF